MEFEEWRDSRRALPENFCWALGASLLLHLLLLDFGVAPARLAGARGERAIVLHVSMSERRVPREFPSALADDQRAASGANSGRLETLFEVVGPAAFPATRETRLTGGRGRRSPPAPAMPAAIEAPLMPAAVADRPRYFRRSELTRLPALLGEPMFDAPDAPDEAGKAPLGGKLSLRLFVSAGGGLDRAEIESSASRADLERAAIAAFRPLRFSPAQIDGVSVNSQVVFEIDFDSQTGDRSRSSGRAFW